MSLERIIKSREPNITINQVRKNLVSIKMN